MRWLCAATLSASLAILVPGSASAQHDDEAHGLFSAGAAAFASGRYDEALDYFQRAYDLSHRSELLFNVGQTADRGRHDAIALEAFRGYLAANPEVLNRAEIEGRIRVLERAVAEHTAAPAPVVSTEPTPSEAAPLTPAIEPPPTDPVASTSMPPPPRDAEPPGAVLDVGAVVLTVSGGVLALGGAIMVGVGAPDLEPPRPGFLFAMEQTRQQNAQILTGVGAAALGLGVIGAVVGVVLLMLPSSPRASALRVTPTGLALSF